MGSSSSQDDEESALALPRTYGVDDIPLDAHQPQVQRRQPDRRPTAIYGDHMLANGVMNAEVAVPAQIVRFRILNAEIERVYNLGFADDRTFWVIGTDGGLLDAPVPRHAPARWSPGERYEIVVDLCADAVGSTLDDAGVQRRLGVRVSPAASRTRTGEFGSLLNNKTFDILRIDGGRQPRATASRSCPAVVDHEHAVDRGRRDQRAHDRDHRHGPGQPVHVRRPGLRHGPDRPDRRARHRRGLAHPERHDLQPLVPHPRRAVLDRVAQHRSGAATTRRGGRTRCTSSEDETVSFVAKFDDFASTDHPFMYHCHMANHEDEGLMGQFLVVDQA